MHILGGSDAPENQGTWEDEEASCEGPETLFGFHYAVVAAGELYNEPVAEAAGEDGAICDG